MNPVEEFRKAPMGQIMRISKKFSIRNSPTGYEENPDKTSPYQNT